MEGDKRMKRFRTQDGNDKSIIVVFEEEYYINEKGDSCYRANPLGTYMGNLEKPPKWAKDSEVIKENRMEKKKTNPEFVKMIIDQFTDEERKEFSKLISNDKDMKPAAAKNKIELQVG